eukprot:8468435-Pyramimonas_sp.AAC.1
MMRAVSGESVCALACASQSNAEHVVDTPTGGRTAANWRQKQISWNPGRKRDVGRVARKGSENCNRVERGAGTWSGLGRSGQE